MNIKTPLGQYIYITLSYWLFTVTDGALRMLVVLHFHNLGYNSLQIAFLFLFYEAFGVLTNLIGGYLGARFGVNRIMSSGLILQLLALSMLLVPESNLTVVWVMMAQALSGIAKDLNKMSAKSAIKFLVPEDAAGKLYSWVALLTGSKNALKGIGFFLGAALLALGSFRLAIGVLIALICTALVITVFTLSPNTGKSAQKTKFKQVFSRSTTINKLSVARLFLFASRDVWFVVGLPVYLSTELQFSHWLTGSFMAIWIILYGFAQTSAPYITRLLWSHTPTGRSSFYWVMLLLFTSIAITLSQILQTKSIYSLLIGLFVFAIVFAVNSSIHSYLIVSYTNRDSASVDVGFYYMANAAGRLCGTLLSGYLFLVGSIQACLLGSCLLLLFTGIASYFLPASRTKA